MTPEDQYWSDKAALLDPACYVFVNGTGWSRTVPAGKVWYLLNGWALRHPDNNYKWHHRNLADPLMLPPGFTLATASYDFGLAYYADPSIVQAADARYQSDPKGLYFERINKLRSIPVEHVNVHRPVGCSSTFTQYQKAAFPTDAERILLRHIDCHDGCWVVLCKEDWSDSMNTQDELDDVRPLRSTHSMMTPINRSVHTHIAIGHGVVSADPTQPQTHNGWGTAMFQRLPSDW